MKMHTSLGTALLLAFGLNASIAMADATLAASKACMACHGIDNKLVGPAFKDVAAKYSGQDDAKDVLMAKVKAGGAGNWGNIPMPGQGHVSDEDIATLVDWILAM